MPNLNSISPVGTRYLPDQLSAIDTAAALKKLHRSAFIRMAATQVARQVIAGKA